MKEYIPTQEELNDKLWRLTHLYYITDKSGNEILFNLNWAQKELFEKEWYQMLVLKARQLGVTTFFSLSFLDDCFWLKNTHAGIIAHRKEDAEDIFKKKVKYAYDRMPQWTRMFNSATNDRTGELAFENGSSYRVSTGFRSGTYQRLLVSEFGKICAKSPDVAKEIVTGSLNTVSTDQVIAIESTAEGREGYFYDFARTAEGLANASSLSPMQQRFFFFPWYEEPGYRERSGDVAVSKEINDYLDRIEFERQRKIDEEQRRWYEMKFRLLGDAMKQEYPSTPTEAFESANEGLYYGMQLAKLRQNGGLSKVPYDDSSVVHTAWDIGLDDFTAIWCFQLERGGLVRIINFYENWDEGADHYCDWLNKQKYRFGRHVFPHDARKRDTGAKTQYIDHVSPLLDGKIVILDIKECDKLEGIQTVRGLLSRCVFDEEKAIKGFKHLEAYKKVWDDRLGCYKNTPLHDEHSHACFVAETLIDCQSGLIPISEISIGDNVRTPNGYRRVSNKYKRKATILQKISYRNHEVYCTPEHEFFTEKGLIYSDALSYNCVPYTINEITECQKKYGSKFCKQSIGFKENFLSQRMVNQSTTMAINTGGMGDIIEHLSQRLDHFQHCIEQFGRSISEIFRNVFTFIILTDRQKTTTYQTCNAYMAMNIPNITWIYQREKINREKASNSPWNMQKNGIGALRVEHGTKSMLKILDSVRINCLWFVENAVRSLQEKSIIKGSVLMHVKPVKDIYQVSTMKSVIAYYATKSSSLINIFLRKPVVKSVPLNLQEPQEVYDLEIEDDHCYYANGFLVSNSDAFRYLAVGLKTMQARDGRKPDDDIKAVNKYYGI
jgi:hypothetical protein